MCPVHDGQAVNETNTNAAFLDAQEDDTALGKITLSNPDALSGSSVTNIQTEHNSIAYYVGKAINALKDALPAWTSTDAGSGTDNITQRTEALTAKFNSTTGHSHSGSSGDGALVSALNLSSVPLQGTFVQGTDISAVTGSSSNILAQFSTKPVSTGSIVAGVVSTSPFNKVVIRQASGSNTDDSFKDALGNVVYGRVTNSGGVGGTWTLSYYVDVSGVETAYSFSGSDVRFYYQQLFNPMSASYPVYSELAIVPSDSTTADVITATTSQQGKVSVSSSAPSAIASSGSAGTSSAAIAANYDHTHEGVHSVSKSGSTALVGDITLTGSNGITLSQASQNIDISAPSLSSTTPEDVGSSGAVGTGSTAARSDHVHKGVHLITDGSTPVYGDITLAGSGSVSVVASGQTIAIGAPIIRSQSVSLTSGLTSYAVTFSSSIGSTGYSLHAQLLNTADSTVQFQPITITAKSATGFTATWNAATDSANYYLMYQAISYV